MDSSVLNRRYYWLRLFRETKGKNEDADVKKWLPTLDIGSHINASFQPRLEAGARHEQRLEGVGCRRLFGQGLEEAPALGWDGL